VLEKGKAKHHSVWMLCGVWTDAQKNIRILQNHKIQNEFEPLLV